MHANLVNDARFATFPSRAARPTRGSRDVTTGPVATMTFTREIDGAVGRPGSGSLVDSLFFDHQPTTPGILAWA